MDTKHELRILCQNVRFLREHHHLSKKEMAQIMKVSIATLNKIEKEIMPPKTSCEIIILLAQAFNVAPYQLFSPLTKIVTALKETTE